MSNSRYFKWILFLLGLVVLLIVSAVVSLSVGEMDISFCDIPKILNKGEGIEYSVLSKLRIPRTILAIAVGGALSISGTILQGIYRNPLVEPYTMGISGGAALGVAICILFGFNVSLGVISLPLFGAIGSFTTIFIVYSLSMRSKRNLNVNKMLLIGVMISFIASSAMMFIMSISTVENLHSIVFWTMGSLNEPNQILINLILISSILALFISYMYVSKLNALRLGESKAKHLGVNTGLTIKVLFIIASFVTGISVAVAGVIGFVGLIIPHIVRYMVGSDYRILLVSSFLGGGVFLCFSDVIARTIISPNELPIGVITGMVGGVVFIFALSQNKKTKI
jgi:iron complex transport system permease protein